MRCTCRCSSCSSSCSSALEPRRSPCPLNRLGRGTPEPIGEAEIADRIRNLRFHPLGIDQRVRVSLAGMQEKLLLSKAGERWALPVEGAPSTHIVKPAHPLLADSIANEALCLCAARHLGIAAAEVELASFAGVPALVIARFDRAVVENDGVQRVRRLHQEDLCQAHGLDTERKYEERGGPSLRQCAELLRRWARSEELESLLDVAVLTCLVGNADAHSKNLALQHTTEGRIRLAPAYDVMTTTYYPQVSPTAGMFVNGVRSIDQITTTDLVDEAVGWGMSRASATVRVERLLESADEGIRRAADEVQAPARLVDALLDRARALRSG